MNRPITIGYTILPTSNTQIGFVYNVPAPSVQNWPVGTAGIQNAFCTYSLPITLPKGTWMTAATAGIRTNATSGTITESLTANLGIWIKGQTIYSKISCPVSTNDLTYKSGDAHIFKVSNTDTNVFSISTNEVATTKPIRSTSTINGLTLQEDGITLSTKYQLKSFTATIKRQSFLWTGYNYQAQDYTNQVSGTLYSFYLYDNKGFYLSPFINDVAVSNFSDNTVQSVQGQIPYDNGLQIRFPNPNDNKYSVSINGIYSNDSSITTNQGLSFQIKNKTNGLMIGGIRHSYFYLRWSYKYNPMKKFPYVIDILDNPSSKIDGETS
jgi:hypothetical protein